MVYLNSSIKTTSQATNILYNDKWGLIVLNEWGLKLHKSMYIKIYIVGHNYS